MWRSVALCSVALCSVALYSVALCSVALCSVALCSVALCSAIWCMFTLFSAHHCVAKILPVDSFQSRCMVRTKVLVAVQFLHIKWLETK